MYEVKYLVFIKFLDSPDIYIYSPDIYIYSPNFKVESVTMPLILLAFGFISPTYFYFFVALDI